MTDLTTDQLVAHLKALLRACANLAAQHERFRGEGRLIHHVHPDSLKTLAAAYRSIPHIHES